MKKLFVLLLLVAFVSLPALGQVTPDLKAGSKALLFSFAGFSNLNAGNFNGGFGVKYWLSDKLAGRGRVLLAITSEDDPANPGPGQTATDGEISATQIGAGVDAEYHFATGRVSPYIGAGIGFTTASTESKDAVIAPTQQTEVDNSAGGELGIQAGTAISVVGLIGAEFFLFKEVSLAAEYQIGFTSLSRSDQTVTQANITQTTKLGSASLLDISTAGFITLGLYF